MSEYELAYGTKSMTFAEERELMETKPFQAQTRQDKIMLVHIAEKMHNFAEYLRDYAKAIPEENDEHHAELVRKLKEDMNAIRKEMEAPFNEDVYKTF